MVLLNSCGCGVFALNFGGKFECRSYACEIRASEILENKFGPLIALELATFNKNWELVNLGRVWNTQKGQIE